jgi:hypothetical protein
MISDNSSNVYGEADGFQVLLGYRCQNCGPCKILFHPKWSSAVYPSSFFTKAPFEALERVIRKHLV